LRDVFDELVERLKQKANSGGFIMVLVAHNHREENDRKWVRLEDVKEAIQQLKQRIREVIDQYIKAYPLDTPEDRQVSRVLNEIREELLTK